MYAGGVRAFGIGRARCIGGETVGASAPVTGQGLLLLANRLDDVGTYPPDPSFVFTGQYEPGSGPSRVTYRYALEAVPREVDVPGRVRFSLGGREYVVYPLLDEGSLLVVFNDRTTGTSTRPPSRFLLIEPPAGGLGHPGIVSLDFNRAHLPPCAFSNEFNCPLAPSHHKFDVEVTAGETWPRFSDLTPSGG